MKYQKSIHQFCTGGVLWVWILALLKVLLQYAELELVAGTELNLATNYNSKTNNHFYAIIDGKIKS